MRVFPSLIDSAMYEFLDEISRYLSIPDAGQDFLKKLDLEAVRRIAGQNFIWTAAAHIFETMELQRVFHACNTIASLKYEGIEGFGQLLIIPSTHPGLEVVIRFTLLIPISDFRAVRKVLQICADDLHLLFDNGALYGLGKVKENNDSNEKNDVFAIQFLKHNVWRFTNGKKPLMVVTNGTPSLPYEYFNRQELKTRIERTFCGISPGAIDDLTSLANMAVSQKHGTILVISQEAAAEAQRLEKQCIRIRPVKLRPEILHSVTAIDGAVLLDPDGVCHAIGVILDGRASKFGSASRGARFNSAIRYLDGADCDCLAVIVSEDGMIDILTNRLLVQ